MSDEQPQSDRSNPGGSGGESEQSDVDPLADESMLLGYVVEIDPDESERLAADLSLDDGESISHITVCRDCGDESESVGDVMNLEVYGGELPYPECYRCGEVIRPERFVDDVDPFEYLEDTDPDSGGDPTSGAGREATSGAVSGSGLNRGSIIWRLRKILSAGDTPSEDSHEYDGFLSYAAEWHALTIGVYYGVINAEPNPGNLPDYDDVRAEPHYFKGGYVIGTVFQLLVIAALLAVGIVLIGEYLL